MAIAFLIRAVPTFIAIYFGATVIDTIVAALPANIMGRLNVAGKIIPAVGIGLLMLLMIKRADLWVFLIAGARLFAFPSAARPNPSYSCVSAQGRRSDGWVRLKALAFSFCAHSSALPEVPWPDGQWSRSAVPRC